MTYSTLLKGLALSALTASFALCFLQPAEARERSERRSPRRERHADERSHRERDNRNDDWGYRAFIPDGGGGQIFYGDPDSTFYPNGNLYGVWDNSGCYDYGDGYGRQRPWRIYRHRDDYGYGDGLSVNLRGDNFSLSYSKRGRRIYSAPDCAEYGYYGNGYYDSATYVYGDGPIVIDGRPRDIDYVNGRSASRYAGPAVYNDNRSYDDNDTINNYYYDDSAPPAQPERSRYIETPREQGPVNPHRDSGLSGQRSIGLRFFDETKLASSDGGWRLSIQGGKLYAGAGKAKGQLVDSKVDERFGAYALWNASHGLSLVYRSGGDVLAASRDSDGSWYSEPLPYNVDFSADNTLGLVSGDLWFTFSATDGLRYVVALRDGVWTELGSASGVR